MKDQPLTVQQAIRRIAVATVLLYLILATTGGYLIWKNRELGQHGDEAHTALCTFEADLRQRVLASVSFLLAHPDGFGGIDAATIANSVRNQAATVYSLQRSLDCDTPDLGPLPPLPGG